MEKEWADARWNSGIYQDQTLMRKPGQQGKFIFPVLLTTNRIGNRTLVMPSLLIVMTAHMMNYVLYPLTELLYVVPSLHDNVARSNPMTDSIVKIGHR